MRNETGAGENWSEGWLSSAYGNKREAERWRLNSSPLSPGSQESDLNFIFGVTNF